MKKKVLGWYRIFIHNLEYKENYFKNVMIIILINLIKLILIL